jgi:hypothetical protein
MRIISYTRDREAASVFIRADMATTSTTTTTTTTTVATKTPVFQKDHTEVRGFDS